MLNRQLIYLCCLFFLAACSSPPTADIPPTEVSVTTNVSANVTAVNTSGADNAMTFSVTIESPDTGCDSYADWWEVVDLDGNLRYRRILAHSHVDEQPFTRSGGPVTVAPNEQVLVRAHMNTGGYGQAMLGTIQDGFQNTNDYEGFASEIETIDPQPANCAF